MAKKEWKNGLFVKLASGICVVILGTSFKLLYGFITEAKEIEGAMSEFKKTTERRLINGERERADLRALLSVYSRERKQTSKKVDTLCESEKKC